MAFLRRCPVFALPALLLCLVPVALHAQARFDLAGPKIDIRVTRNNVTLPIAAVPNLQPRDTIWLHPDFPPSQSVHYLLIAVFLRGNTNPPPADWFTRIETWDKRVREEGVFITVPDEAQQAILFLAPQTGGDFSTLRSAVSKHPANFVRASQDLTEAGFEQARIETYLEEIKKVPPGDSAALLAHSNLLARTLNLKPNPDCFKRPVDQQYNCLTQTGTQLLLDDGHGQSVVAALSNGPGSDFINAASYTGIAGGGVYSAYVGAIVDLVRLTSTLHTAQYQYIPAIAFPDTGGSNNTNAGETLNLRLNMPPSFANPKSVIVIGLPTVQKSVLPPLRPAEPDHISCLLDPHMVLPIEGAPLVFSTSYAHHLVLHLNLPADPKASKHSSERDLPLIADAYQGGLTINANPSTRKELPVNLDDPDPITDLNHPDPRPAVEAKQEPTPAKQVPLAAPLTPGAPITGTIEGYWGFDRYIGPTLPLENVPGEGWRIVTSPETPTVLIAGQPNHLQLEATGTACVQSISLEPGDAKVDWKLTPPPAPPKTPVTIEAPPTPAAVIPPVRPIEVTLNLQKAATPGSIRLAIQQFGEKEPDHLGTKSFAEPAKIESLHIHTGDLTVTLNGNSLSQVKDLTFPATTKDLTWTPEPSSNSSDTTLTLSLPKDTKPPSLKPNEKLTAEVHLQDGRTLTTSTLVLPARPEVTILSRRVNLPTPSPIQLASSEDLPLGAELTFFLKSREKFPRNEEIEIASKDADAGSPADQQLDVKLSIAAGSLVLEDNHTILANFDPLKTFGPSTFGQFRLRALGADGTHGEWLPLATIVRLPTLTDLHCPTTPATKDQPCQLSGSALYLIDSISTDAAFTDPTAVPEGFVDTTLSIPHPAVDPTAAPKPHTGPHAPTPVTFYIRLRDDPTAADPVTLALDPPPAPSTRQHAAAPAPSPAPTPSVTTPPAASPTTTTPPTQ